MAQKPCLILDNEFIAYCKVNDITDVEKYAKEIFDKAFVNIKYGTRPSVFVEVKSEEPIKQLKTPENPINPPIVAKEIIKPIEVGDNPPPIVKMVEPIIEVKKEEPQPVKVVTKKPKLQPNEVVISTGLYKPVPKNTDDLYD